MAPIGRDRELEAVASALHDGRVVLVEGEAGIGKTTVWRAGIEQAEGFRVLTCAPTGAETELSLAALRDLLGEAFDELSDELPAPQRRALAAALLREEPDGPPPAADAVAAAFLSTLRALARRGPVLVAADDVQWLDAPSAAAIAYALRRVSDEPVAFLLARRTEGEEQLPLGLDRLPRERLELLQLGALSIGALGGILHDELGTAHPRPTLHRIHEAAGGNPFFALELARALGEADRLRPGDPLPVPSTLRELVEERLRVLPRPTLELLTVAAALSRPTLAILEAAQRGDVEAELRPALDAGVARVDGEEVRFTHPLFAGALYAGVRPMLRSEIHRRLAAVVPDAEERAGHLARGTEQPDEDVASAIENGAREAFKRGGTAAAAELAAEARRLTPATSREERWRRTVAEADYAFASGDTARASALLEELVADTSPGARLAGLLSRQARILHFERDISASVELLYRALAEAGDDDALRGEIEEGLAWGLLLTRTDLAAAAEHAQSAARLAETRGDEAALAEALAAEALTAFVLGRPWGETMERALALEEATLHLRVLRHPSFALGYCLSCADEVDAAREVFERLLARADENGDESSPPSLRNHLTMVELLAGRWSAADVHARDGYERALEGGHLPTQASILGKLAMLAARRGDLAEAREAGLAALEIAGPPEEALVRGGETAIWALGFAELSAGDPGAAHAWLGPLCDALLAAGIEEPGELRALPDEVEALALLGRRAEAERLVEALECWAARLERPSVVGAALRSRALLGDDDEALSRASAVGELPFEHGRTLLALGAQQRRARQRRVARETLSRAETIFAELGSDLWAGRARAELARIGGRQASRDELTPTERRIAELVAEGKKNKEVAAELVVTERTVESALTQIYRKLDVRSRTELARKLSQPD